MRKNLLREKLSEFMTEDELSRLKTAYDVVGDIAILEIDDEFKDKEKRIAETLLGLHKNIKTILKKAGDHSGKFRKQKMAFLAGEDKRIGLHKENNSFIYVDVENSYFSPRLSTERKRIMQQVKNGENILVMFSGVGPYPAVISRNKTPRNITTIEANPKAHKIAQLNKKKNKLNNVQFHKGDVRKVLPNLTAKAKIGLKSSWKKNQLNIKLSNLPELIEIHIGKGDLENNFEEFEKTISSLANKGLEVVLHVPLVYKGLEVAPASDIPEIIESTKECFSLLEKLCQKYKLKGFVGHPYSFTKKERSYKGKTYKHTLKNIYRFFQNHKFKHLFLENIMFGPFANPSTVINASKRLSFNLCVDVAHLYLYSRSKEAFYESFKKFPENTYYHLADAKFMGVREKIAHERHSFPLGFGEVNFDKILPYVKRGVAEVLNKDENNPKEMVMSWKRLNKISNTIKRYDRILMPLPKSAEDFLDLALSVARKNAIIHFYDFLHSDDFYLAEEKVKIACKAAGLKYKKLDFVRCGQHSPRTFRVCLDFRVY
ncbi:MAG: hypothetical protein ACQESF_04495 [Nanobdellota archaeon]